MHIIYNMINDWISINELPFVLFIYLLVNGRTLVRHADLGRGLVRLSLGLAALALLGLLALADGRDGFGLGHAFHVQVRFLAHLRFLGL